MNFYASESNPFDENSLRITQQIIQNRQIILIRIKIQNNQAQTNYNWGLTIIKFNCGSHSNNLFP